MAQTFAVAGDHEARLTQLLRIAQQEAQLAQRSASPRMEDALIEVEHALAEQLAVLVLANEDDAADAEASGAAERKRQAWRPLRAV
jgi:hypothetical protein